jgi:hypothetical protein
MPNSIGEAVFLAKCEKFNGKKSPFAAVKNDNDAHLAQEIANSKK